MTFAYWFEYFQRSNIQDGTYSIGEEAWDAAKADDIPTEPQHGRDYCNPCSHPEFRMHIGCDECPQREPDKVKPLAQYLAEYVEPLDHSDSYITGWRELLEQALDAYEVNEEVRIKIERK